LRLTNTETWIARLPYGVYQLEIEARGFVPVDQMIDVRSSIPLYHSMALHLADGGLTEIYLLGQRQSRRAAR
jgi:hypothetical protein